MSMLNVDWRLSRRKKVKCNLVWLWVGFLFSVESFSFMMLLHSGIQNYEWAEIMLWWAKPPFIQFIHSFNSFVLFTHSFSSFVSFSLSLLGASSGVKRHQTRRILRECKRGKLRLGWRPELELRQEQSKPQRDLRQREPKRARSPNQVCSYSFIHSLFPKQKQKQTSISLLLNINININLALAPVTIWRDREKGASVCRSSFSFLFCSVLTCPRRRRWVPSSPLWWGGRTSQ